METKICFFSSNKRALYQEDIIKALSLPSGYTLHFRYQKKWIQDIVLAQSSRVVGKEGIIFYAHFEKASDTPIITSIRAVTVKEVAEDNDNELIHYYLELGDFVNTPIDFSALKSFIPPTMSVSQLSLNAINNCSWVNRIDTTHSLLERRTFFYLKAIYKEGTKLVPTYSEYEKESFYTLEDEGECFFEVNYADYSDGEEKYNYLTDESKIFINVQKDFTLGALKDQRRHNVITHGISKSKVPSMVRIGGVKRFV